MAEVLVKNPYCSKCGEDARPQAQFCFACGGQVIFPESPAEEESVSSEWFKGDIVADNNDAKAKESDSGDIEKSQVSGSLKAIPKPQLDTVSERDESETAGKETETKVRVKPKKEEKGAEGKTKKLRSAADLRKKPKPTRTKRVEVVWEENEGSPNWIFVSLGFTMIVLAAVIVYLAIYLK